jgi:GWxTD domain-containing protein
MKLITFAQLAVSLICVVFSQAQNKNDLRRLTDYNFTVRIPDIIYYDLNPSFIDESGHVQLDFYLDILNGVLAFDRGQTNFSSLLKIEITLMDTLDNFIQRELWDEHIQFPLNEFQLEKNKYTRIQHTFKIKSGKYRISISLIDATSNKTKEFSSELLLNTAHKDKSYITDFKFYKNNRYESNQSSLSYNADYNINYAYFSPEPLQLEFKIKTKNGKLVFTTSKDLLATEKLIHLSDSLPISKLKEGQYQFSALVNGKVVSLKEFEVYWWEKPILLNELEFAFRPFELVLSPQELEAFQLKDRFEKEQFFKQFWNDKEKTNYNGYNPLMHEFYSRVDYAIKKYSEKARIGYLTDLGRTYILHGKPIKEEKIFVENRTILVWTFQDDVQYFVYSENEKRYLLSDKQGRLLD